MSIHKQGVPIISGVQNPTRSLRIFLSPPEPWWPTNRRHVTLPQRLDTEAEQVDPEHNEEEPHHQLPAEQALVDPTNHPVDQQNHHADARVDDEALDFLVAAVDSMLLDQLQEEHEHVAQDAVVLDCLALVDLALDFDRPPPDFLGFLL